MKVHHLNCATLCPIAGRLIGAARGQRAEMVCHCLLIETDDGLVLVDTGFGLGDVAEGSARLGRAVTSVLRPRFDPAETAVRQVEALGFSVEDVRHIVVTHLDLDHAGGLADFPAATVHVFEPEHTEAMTRPTMNARRRYFPVHWAHQPSWKTYAVEGEPWFGFECVRPLEGVPPEILLVPLAGHSRGHCGVGVSSSNGWLLHCGDAYFYHGQVADEPHCPVGLRLFQWLAGLESRARKENQRRLRELAREHHDEVTLFCAHDSVELRRLVGE